MPEFANTAEFTRSLDEGDELKEFRKEFVFPDHGGKPVLYFTGNSLGLQPGNAGEAVKAEIDDWGKFGVEGHFNSRIPWYYYGETLKPMLAEVVGAKPVEVAAMGSLTADLHFLMVSFYRPVNSRYKILCEARPFPSDRYALESQVRFHGYEPSDAIVEVHPREGEHVINEEDIYRILREKGSEIALVLIGGVNFYTGQLFDMEKITEKGHEAGAVVGFDLAHAAGNARLRLHDWGVDFAVWCSYKYLNSGPGSVAGIFIHERYGTGEGLPRFEGWWGNKAETRFQMRQDFSPAPGADGWQLSNAPVFSMAVHRVALDQFLRAGMEKLFRKSEKLSAYLEFVIGDCTSQSRALNFEIITPRDSRRRAAQISLLTDEKGREIFNYLSDSGVVADWRDPNVIRMAPVPLYNSFTDIYEFGRILKEAGDQ